MLPESVIVDYNAAEWREALALSVSAERPGKRSLEMLQGFAEGRESGEIAKVTGIKPSTVRQMVASARDRLCARTIPAAVYSGLALGIIRVTYPEGDRGLSTGSVSGLGFEIDPTERLMIDALARGFAPGEIQEVLNVEGLYPGGSFGRKLRNLRKRVRAANLAEVIRRSFELGLIDPHNGGPPAMPPLWGPDFMQPARGRTRRPQEAPGGPVSPSVLSEALRADYAGRGLSRGR